MTKPARESRNSSAADNWPQLLLDGSEMGERIYNYDWSTTSLGPIEKWPQSLRALVSMMVANSFPMVLWAGSDYVQIYNDAYIPILGGNHPTGLGQTCQQCWPEVWHLVEPIFDSVYETGEAVAIDDQHFPVTRHGYLEEVYCLTAYSPARVENGEIGHILVTMTETTGRVLSERRLQLLRDLSGRTPDAQTSEEACNISAEVLEAGNADVSFALLYLCDEDGAQAHLTATAGLEAGQQASPTVVALDGRESERDGWPLGEAYRSGTQRVDDLEARFEDLPGGAWPEPPTTALVLPLASATQEQPVGFLVAGVSPRRALDDDYHKFFDLVAERLSSAITNVRAYEEERKRAEALAKLDRAKTEFFSNVSHEFRTPLTLMLGPLEEMLEGEGDVVTAPRENLEITHRNGLRLLKLVNTLLEFSRIEAGRIEANYRPTDLAALTADLASMFRSAIEHAGLHLIVDTPSLSEPVYLDRSMWEKIVMNLLSNAFKHTFEGEIEISLRETDEHAELHVRDTGTGIPAEQLPRLFERFQRLQDARSRTHEGTGIGLALVDELMKLHGGAIEVESEVGEGTVFTVRLPLGQAHLPEDQIGGEDDAQTAETPKESPHVEEALSWLANGPEDVHQKQEDVTGGEHLERAHILLADDNADMRAYIHRLLRAQYEVEAVGDGKKALQAARERRPDLILADIMMPGLDGFDLLDELRSDEATRSIPVIFLSARAGEEARVEGLEAGADDYLVKPFDARELMARVSGNLQMAHMRREAALVEAKEHAEEMNRLKTVFLANMSHEIRTPLTGIISLASLMARRVTEEHRESMQDIKKSGKRLKDALDTVLRMAELEAGRAEVDLKEVPVADRVEEVAKRMKPRAKEKGLTFTFSVAPEAKGIRAQLDPGALESILQNLIGNAIKFTEDGNITVTIDTQIGDGRKERAYLRVTDTGVGIAEDFMPHLFDDFRQESAGMSRSHEGTGLGLSITKRLVELMDGRIEVESEKGEGSTFTVSFPAANDK